MNAFEMNCEAAGHNAYWNGYITECPDLPSELEAEAKAMGALEEALRLFAMGWSDAKAEDE